MSCTPITAAMRQLLEALTAWPNVNVDDLRSRPEWAQARRWGWVMASGELTGTGLAHVRELSPCYFPTSTPADQATNATVNYII